MCLLSVIVPAYNLERFIAQGVASVLGQSFTDLECIVVDDESLDGTADLVERLAEKDPRLRLIRSEHAGVSHCRNLGLEAARGTFVTFMDGDDLLSPDCARFFADVLRRDASIDLFLFGIEYMAPGEERMEGKKAFPPALCFADGHELADWYIRNQVILLYSTGNKFYRRELLCQNGLRFAEGVDFGEDRLFNYAYLKLCGRILCMNVCFYRYRQINPQSLSHRFRPHHSQEVYALHRAKVETMFSLARNALPSEREAFESEDLKKEALRAIEHITFYEGCLSPEEVLDEFRVLLRTFGPALRKKENREGSAALDEAVARINAAVFIPLEQPDPAIFDAVLILGSTNCDYRVQEAVRLFGAPHPTFICSGGNPSANTDEQGNRLSEAEYMRRVLRQNGIADENIYLDTTAKNSWENIANVREWIREKRMCIVTAAFHIRRIRDILRELELQAQFLPASGSHTRADNWYENDEGVAIILSELVKNDREEAARLIDRFLIALFGLE